MNQAEDRGSAPWEIFESIGLWCHRAGSVALVMAISARQLFPSEDADEGSGIFFFPSAIACGMLLAAERVVGVRSAKMASWLAIWLLLIGALVLSASGAEYSFPATAMAWEWVGTALVALYAFHWGSVAGPGRLASLVVVVALMQSILAGYEINVRAPQLRALYEKGDLSIAREMREYGVELGSPMERVFRDRLYSTEPMGTTGHPNSFAGVLVFALPTVLTLAFASLGRQGLGVLGTALALVSATGVVTALVASKSRSAWLAAVVAVGAVLLLNNRGRVTSRQLAAGLLVSGVTLGLIVAAFIASGILDPQVVTEAPKSLAYRWEWWQATLSVIAESPLTGVGAGNFRSHYLAYKLPFSSEEISDPHNFALELAATGGCLALLAYLMLAGCAAAWVIRAFENDGGVTRNVGLDRWDAAGLVLAIVLAVVLDFGFLPMVASPASYPGVWALLPAALALMLVGRVGVVWSDASVRRALLAGIIGLHVHWLAAGGVMYPSLMLLSWGSLAAAGGRVDGGRPTPFWQGCLWVLVISAVVLLHSFNVLAPRIEAELLSAQARKLEGEVARRAERLTPAGVMPEVWRDLVPTYEFWVEACELAARAEPANRKRWEQLAAAQTGRMRLLARLRSPTELSAYRSAVAAWKDVIALEPRRSESHRQLALLRREAAASGLDSEGMGLAEEGFAEAARLYPNSAARQWEWGDLLSVLNRREAALQAFQRALELDKTPHRDKKLTEFQRSVAETWIKGYSAKTSP